MKTRSIAILCAALTLPAISTLLADTHAFIWSSDAGMSDIGSLGGPTTIARAINDSGQVVGISDLADNMGSHAFIWTEANGMVDLGTAGGSYSIAFDVNSSGAVTGTTSLASGIQVGFYWSESTGMVALPQSGPNQSEGLGINDSNQITGEGYAGLFSDKAFIWDFNAGITRALGNLTGAIWNSGIAINSLGRITGPAGFPNDTYHVFLWRREDGMHDLGTPPGVTRPFPTSINDQNEIVGFSNESPVVAFYFRRSIGFRILSTLAGGSTVGQKINNLGNIAGFSLLPTTVAYHAVLWNDSLSAAQDLGTLPGDTSSQANGVNNLGQVVGSSSSP